MVSLITKEDRMSKTKKFWLFLGAVNGMFLALVAITVLTGSPVQMTAGAALIFLGMGIISFFGCMLSTTN
ncbi:MAG: hypothetical protein HY093_05050 [Candidatus Liptonbacteria bacterium]|nr:hypothetical protein [Candidatus Liptonbacteria bacterium]